MSRRPERLAAGMRQELAALVAALKDPRVGFVSITRVEASGDLRHARVHVSVLGDEKQRRDSLQALRRASGFLRRELGRRMRLRRMPELEMRYDPGIDATQRIAELLHANPISAETEEGADAQGAPGFDDLADDDPDR